MTKAEATKTAAEMRAAGWPRVYIEERADGTWRAIGEDFSLRPVHMELAR